MKDILYYVCMNKYICMYSKCLVNKNNNIFSFIYDVIFFYGILLYKWVVFRMFCNFEM